MTTPYCKNKSISFKACSSISKRQIGKKLWPSLKGLKKKKHEPSNSSCHLIGSFQSLQTLPLHQVSHTFGLHARREDDKVPHFLWGSRSSSRAPSAELRHAIQRTLVPVPSPDQGALRAPRTPGEEWVCFQFVSRSSTTEMTWNDMNNRQLANMVGTCMRLWFTSRQKIGQVCGVEEQPNAQHSLSSSTLEGWSVTPWEAVRTSRRIPTNPTSGMLCPLEMHLMAVDGGHMHLNSFLAHLQDTYQTCSDMPRTWTKVFEAMRRRPIFQRTWMPVPPSFCL